MSLQFQDERKQAERKFKSINLDISILNGLAKPSGALKDIDVKPKPSKLSMNELSSILINKNKKLSGLQPQKKQAVEWLKHKGLDWRKVTLEIKENAILAEQKATIMRQKQLQARGIESVIGIKGHLALQPQKQTIFTKQMQDEFLQRQKQVHLCKVIMKSLTNTKQKSNTRSALMSKIRGEELMGGKYDSHTMRQHGQQGEILSSRQQQTNLQLIRNQYFEFVHTLSASGFDSSMHMLKKIRPFWRIILQHIKTIQHYAPQLYQRGCHQEFVRLSSSQLNDTATTQYDLRMSQYLMIKSLKMIERQFEKTLPDVGYSFEKLDEVVRDMERRNHKLKVWRNSNGEATWAMTFLLLKAGRINEIKRVLESVDRDILWAIVTHNMSINSQKPQKSLKHHDIHKYNDTFYVQIIRILEGIPTFDRQIIISSDPYLTRAWILLITMGIYSAIPQMNHTFNIMNDNIIGLQCNSTQPIDENKIQQYLYLGNYKKFIYLMEMILLENKLPQKLSSSFIYDDYFHLMVVLLNYPEMWGNSTGVQLVGLQGKYAETLTQYMARLRLEKNKTQLPYYLMLCQGQRLQRVTTDLITTVNQYQQFDWRTLRELMKIRDPKSGSRLFKQLSKTVLDSLKLTHFSDFLFAAQAYHIDFASSQDSLYLQQRCYLKLLLGYLYFLAKKRQLLRSNLPTWDFNSQMYQFFGIDKQQKNSIALSQRDNEIKRRVKECEDKLQSTVVRNSTDQEYIANILIPFEFYKKFSQFIKLLQNSQTTVNDLKKFDPRWTNKLRIEQKHDFQEGAQPVLLRFLGFEFSQSNYSNLYVYYLSELIERKRMLCSIDCDYTGVVTQLRQVAGLLKHLQSFYQKRLFELRKSEGRVFGEQKRILIEQSTNPLSNSGEYRRLKQLIKQMIGEDVEVGLLQEEVAGLRLQREMTPQQRRRTIKARYSANEYFREELGY